MGLASLKKALAGVSLAKNGWMMGGVFDNGDDGVIGIGGKSVGRGVGGNMTPAA
jgi:hypothetical protein